MKLLPLFGALALFAGCGDDPTIVELTVIETIPVDFDDMDGGVVEGAIIPLDDLRNEPRYVEAVGSLKCGSLDVAASFIEVEALQIAAGATVLDYQVQIGPRGGQLARLAQFNGSITAGERIALSDPRITVDQNGLDVVRATVRGAEPVMQVQISASVPGPLDDLQVAVSLTIEFSSVASACPVRARV